MRLIVQCSYLEKYMTLRVWQQSYPGPPALLLTGYMTHIKLTF